MNTTRKIKVNNKEIKINKMYELDFNRAAALVKEGKTNIPMAVAVVTGDVKEALYLLKRLREVFSNPFGTRLTDEA